MKRVTLLLTTTIILSVMLIAPFSIKVSAKVESKYSLFEKSYYIEDTEILKVNIK